MAKFEVVSNVNDSFRDKNGNLINKPTRQVKEIVEASSRQEAEKKVWGRDVRRNTSSNSNPESGHWQSRTNQQAREIRSEDSPGQENNRRVQSNSSDWSRKRSDEDGLEAMGALVGASFMLLGLGWQTVRAGYSGYKYVKEELKKSPEQRKQERDEREIRKKIEQEEKEERRRLAAKQRIIDAENEKKEREQEWKEFWEEKKVEAFNAQRQFLPFNIYTSRFLGSLLVSLASMPCFFACFKEPSPIVLLFFVLVPYSLFMGIRPALMARRINTEQELHCMVKSVSIRYHLLIVFAIYIVVFFGCGTIAAKSNLNMESNTLAVIGIRAIMISSYLSGILIFLLGIHKKPNLSS